MNELLKIAARYDHLREEIQKEMTLFFNSRNVDELNTKWLEGKLVPKFKKLEKEADVEIEHFVNTSVEYIDKQGLNESEFTKELSHYLLHPEKQINHYLFIQLIWRLTQEKNKEPISIEILNSLVKSLITSDIIEQPNYYYLECYLDIWDSISHSSIPVGLIKKILLLKPNSDDSHSLTIKGDVYLRNHGTYQYEQTMNELKNNPNFPMSQYYRVANTRYNK